MAVLGSAALLEAEIDAGIEAFKLLEPEVQRGFIALFHLFHHKQKQVAAAELAANAAKALQDLSSASLDASTPSTG